MLVKSTASINRRTHPQDAGPFPAAGSIDKAPMPTRRLPFQWGLIDAEVARVRRLSLSVSLSARRAWANDGTSKALAPS